jgi:hypothetical protein
MCRKCRRSKLSMVRFIFFMSLGLFLNKAFAKDCLEIIKRVEKVYNIPNGLLYAIAKKESRCTPYAVSRGRQSFFFSSLKETIPFVQDAYRRGFKNLNVGCMQINFRSHKHSFSNALEMIHPEINIDYAARLLRNAYQRYGSWERAVRVYNSGKPYGSTRYWRSICALWGR